MDVVVSSLRYAGYDILMMFVDVKLQRCPARITQIEAAPN